MCLPYSVRHEHKCAKNDYRAGASAGHTGRAFNARRIHYRPKAGREGFELKRLDVAEQSILKGLDQLFQDIPNPGEPARTNLARIIIEDRE